MRVSVHVFLFLLFVGCLKNVVLKMKLGCLCIYCSLKFRKEKRAFCCALLFNKKREKEEKHCTICMKLHLKIQYTMLELGDMA